MDINKCIITEHEKTEEIRRTIEWNQRDKYLTKSIGDFADVNLFFQIYIEKYNINFLIKTQYQDAIPATNIDRFSF